MTVAEGADNVEPRRIDFFIAGAQKCGTTALWSKLSRHPGLCCSEPKELHLFDDETRDWGHAPIPDVRAHFPADSQDRLWGEATPIYVYWPQAMERLARYNPRARLIIGLRHPAWRALSHWKMEVTRGAESLSFDDAISDAGRARAKPVHRVFSYVERGFYAGQVARVLAHFPREAVHFHRMEDLYRDEARVLAAICGFLGVEQGAFDTGPRHVVPVDSRGLRVEAEAALARLTALYADDIRETARLTGLGLDSWLDGRYREEFLECA